jgi:hypothetical protein
MEHEQIGKAGDASTVATAIGEHLGETSTRRYLVAAGHS